MAIRRKPVIFRAIDGEVRILPSCGAVETRRAGSSCWWGRFTIEGWLKAIVLERLLAELERLRHG